MLFVSFNLLKSSLTVLIYTHRHDSFLTKLSFFWVSIFVNALHRGSLFNNLVSKFPN